MQNSGTENPLAKRLKILTDFNMPSSSNNLHEIENISFTDSDNSYVKQLDTADSILKAHHVINFDLNSLLNNNIIGRAILLENEKGKPLDNKDRNNLCEIIVCYFLNDGVRLNNTSISIMANKIVEMFREE